MANRKGLLEIWNCLTIQQNKKKNIKSGVFVNDHANAELSLRPSCAGCAEVLFLQGFFAFSNALRKRAWIELDAKCTLHWFWTQNQEP
ncbi:unnamed protein product [Dovyalis caffra]|uniref:Uncharacterized protein n=1 Tax=Dovyalis caffra TaxID=77055 RepID=A0AAV1RJZ1_9ROSI|nr:unnamed protein product [Dovyalis caffra]